MVQTASRTKAENALAELMQGNQRFQQGSLQKCVFSQERFNQGKSGQSPPAIVLSCSDSRVPPEMVMDQGIGDIFVIRVAGNVLDNNALASMMYAMSHLGSRLVVVMGHSKCGACTAAQGAYISAQGNGSQSKATDPISTLLSPIVDCCGSLAKNAGGNSGDLKSQLPVESVVESNAVQVASTTLQALSSNLSSDIMGEVVIVAGKYDLDDGSVRVLQQFAS